MASLLAGARGGAAAPAVSSRLGLLLRRNFTPTHVQPPAGAISRHFSSATTPDPPPESEPPPRRPPPPSVAPVYYAPKPSPSEKPPAADSIEVSPRLPPAADPVEVSPRLPPVDQRRAEQRSDAAEQQPERREWTREEMRYMKSMPAVSPVSYPTKVAPLPEDRVVKREEEVDEEEVKKNEQLARERRRIEMEARLRMQPKVEEEYVPYPTFIKVEKRKPKAVLDLQDAIRQVKSNAKKNFLETVEAHVNLGVDPRRGDQMVRGAATLPHGTGKTVRVAVFAEGTAAEEARAAGADIVGGDDLVDEVKNGGGKLNFDKCIATPSFMPRLAKVARILGPRGMMPNPKLGSVTSDVAAAVQAAKRGRVDFKIDKTAIVHVGLGKVNFSEEALRENIGAFVNALLIAKPVGLKKTSKYVGYVKNFTLSSTMGPGFPVSIQSLSIAADQFSKQQQLK